MDKSTHTCDGCFIFSRQPCPYSRLDNVDECPCLMCLVKVVCDVACKEYETFIKKQREISYVIQQSNETRV